MQRDTETLLSYEMHKAPATFPGAIVLRVRYHRPKGGVDQYMVHLMYKMPDPQRPGFYREVFYAGDYYPVLREEDPREMYYQAVKAWLKRVERYKLNHQAAEEREHATLQG